jgi:hypothetical protein
MSVSPTSRLQGWCLENKFDSLFEGLVELGVTSLDQLENVSQEELQRLGAKPFVLKKWNKLAAEAAHDFNEMKLFLAKFRGLSNDLYILSRLHESGILTAEERSRAAEKRRSQLLLEVLESTSISTSISAAVSSSVTTPQLMLPTFNLRQWCFEYGFDSIFEKLVDIDVKSFFLSGPRSVRGASHAACIRCKAQAV